MDRRALPLLAVAVLLSVSVPSGASAEGSLNAACRQPVKKAKPQSASHVVPTVMARNDDGDYFGLYVNGFTGRTTFSDCAWHDANRNGRYDRRERYFGYRVTAVADDPGLPYGIWRQQVAYRGVAKGQQVCSVHNRTESPPGGGTATRTQSPTSCFVVGAYYNGEYYED